MKRSGGVWKTCGSSGNTTPTLSINATIGRNGVKYRCRITGADGTVYSDAAKLTVISESHEHIWVAKTIHHDEDGYYQSVKVQSGTDIMRIGVETVVDEEGWEEYVGGGYVCNGCGAFFQGGEEIMSHMLHCEDNDAWSYSVKRPDAIWHPPVTHQEPIYGEGPVYSAEEIWVVVSEAWDETITVCRDCGMA